MGNLLAYSGIVTKIRAMEARLLNDKNFEEIAELHSVPEIVSYLKEKYVEPIFLIEKYLNL